MTTVAYANGVLASDGKITAGCCVTNLNSKKIFRVDSAWIGVCGTVADWGLVIDYLNNNGSPIPPNTAFDCIYMPDKGKAVILAVCKGGILREIAFTPPHLQRREEVTNRVKNLNTKPSTIIAELGEYEILRYESTFTTRAALVRNLEILLPFDFQDWVDNPSIEYWMKEYINLQYEEYDAKFKQAKALMEEGVIIENDILDVYNTLDYYRGFKKEGD